MRFRPFLNTDPPALARLWSSQPPLRGRVNHVSAQLLETYVFSKPYFASDDLMVAEEDGKLVGFAHVGFGPNESHTDLCREMGVVCMVMVAPEFSDTSLANQLLSQAEMRLREQGAKLIYGGCISPLNPFYLGLYGGSEMPGILASDHQQCELFLKSGYEEIDQVVVLQRKLDGFRSPIDRRLMQLRRRFRVELDNAPPLNDWWESCVAPPAEPTRFEIYPIDGGASCGSVSFWMMEPLSDEWGVLSVGMTQLTVPEGLKRRGMATYLKGEALRQLQLNGVGLVEVQTMTSNAAALGLYHKLGFQQIDQGLILRKSVS